MKTRLLLIIFTFAISCVSYSSCKNKESELKVNSDKNTLKTDIPVTKENKFYASSTRKNFSPENVFDYDDKTFLVSGEKCHKRMAGSLYRETGNFGKI